MTNDGSALRVGREVRRENFDGDAAPQFQVGGLIHLAHASRAEMGSYFIVCESGSDHVVTKMRGRILSNNPQRDAEFHF